jgi:hypothetical protein
MKWQTQTLRPQRFRAADSTRTARLTLTSGDTLIVRGPVIAGDSLVGRQKRPGVAFDSLPRVSVPLAAIHTAELRQPDGVATAGLVLVGLTAAVLVWASTNPCIALCPTH